ncbi:hypothetical protein [Montanilutibacter psychrotolerans]|uniref:hypothetical protein n=1 Tax=Montanilutibacter psychrotolerans TaxID=1327343 RepID=UPI0016815056|nr:hypothetical protein [Lysobacter psychrotolerans]
MLQHRQNGEGDRLRSMAANGDVPVAHAHDAATTQRPLDGLTRRGLVTVVAVASRHG